MPHYTKRRNVLYDNRTKDYARFVHYTSADAALKIINSKRVWMSGAILAESGKKLGVRRPDEDRRRWANSSEPTAVGRSGVRGPH